MLFRSRGRAAEAELRHQRVVHGEALVAERGKRTCRTGELADQDAGTELGQALAVPGNHEDKLLRALRGRKVRVSHGLETTLEQLAAEPAEFRAVVETFLDSLRSHYVLDGGRLVVAHAGLAEKLQGRA